MARTKHKPRVGYQDGGEVAYDESVPRPILRPKPRPEAPDDTIYPTTAPDWGDTGADPYQAAMAVGYARGGPVGAQDGSVQPGADINKRAALLAGLRKRYDAMIGMAQGALAHRDENAAVRFAQRAHDMVPDGKSLILHVQPDGNVLAIVHDPRGGEQSRHVMTPDQFHHYLIGPATSFDHVIENGVGHNLGIATGRPTPRTPDHPADPIHKVRQVLQHTRRMFGIDKIGQTPPRIGYAAGGPVRGYDDGGEVDDALPPDPPWTNQDERDYPPPPDVPADNSIDDYMLNAQRGMASAPAQRDAPTQQEAPATAGSGMGELLARAAKEKWNRNLANAPQSASVPGAVSDAWGSIKQGLADYINGTNAASPAELSQAKQAVADANPDKSTPEIVQSIIADPSNIQTPSFREEVQTPASFADPSNIQAPSFREVAAERNNEQTPASWADTAGYTPRTGYFDRTAGSGGPQQNIVPGVDPRAQRQGQGQGYGIAPLSPAELKYSNNLVSEKLVNDPKRPYLHGADPQTGIVPENERKYYGTVNDPPESRYGLPRDDPKTVILNARGAILAIDPENTADLDKIVTRGPRINYNNPSAYGGYDPRAGAIIDRNTGERSPIYNSRIHIGYIGSDGNVQTPQGRSFNPDSRYGGGPTTGGAPQHAATDSAGRPWYDVPGQPLPAWAAGRGQPADVEGKPLPRQPSQEDLRPVGRNINGVPVNRNGEIIKPDGTLEFTPGYQSQQTVVDPRTGERLDMTGGTGIPIQPREGTPGGTGVRGSLNRPFGFSAKDQAYQNLSASGALDIVPSDKYGRSPEAQASEGARPWTQDMARRTAAGEGPMPRGAPPMYVTERPAPYYDPNTGQVVTPPRQVMPSSGPPVGVAPGSPEAGTQRYGTWQPLNIPGAANHPPPEGDNSPAARAARAFPMASQTRQRVQYQAQLERQGQEDQLKRDTLATRDTPADRMARERLKQDGYIVRNMNNNQQKQFATETRKIISDNTLFQRAYDTLAREAGGAAAELLKDYRARIMNDPNYKGSDEELGAIKRAIDLVNQNQNTAPPTPQPGPAAPIQAPAPGGGAAPAAPAQQSPNSVLRVPPAQQNLPSRPSAPPPPVPAGLSAQAQWSPSRQQWRTPDGKLYDRNGRPVGP